ncbi:uncharacterized protein LOC124152750 [Haliotis rufescens]|uniref:uncharacterized protein LOC124152750 n=1 Tax=Haliotis rufescens TaxID=6454 RepID=UPI00201EF3F3|nr:uncharacterized protein LOC124152750 [Haliotis rufescens]
MCVLMQLYTMKIFVLLSLTLMLMWRVEGGCEYSEIEVTHGEGQLYFHCPHIDFILRPGQSRVASNCKLCTCTMRGLRCCGIASHNIGTMHLPSGCQVVQSDSSRCGYRVARRYDNTIDC